MKIAMKRNLAITALLATSAAMAQGKPVCGLDSVYNRQTQNNLWGHMPTNERCRLYMGLFDIIFEKLQDERA